MQLRTVTWNIGGGRIKVKLGPIELERLYTVEGLGHIQQFLGKLQPDIITLQETHENAQMSQVATLAKNLGYQYFFNDHYSDSHLDHRYKLGQAVLSRYPIHDHSFQFLDNPGWVVPLPGFRQWSSHNKGVSSCVVNVQGLPLEIKTLHLLPFRMVNMQEKKEDIVRMKANITHLTQPRFDRCLVQGDFNFAAIQELVPHLFQRGAEVPLSGPTRPDKLVCDHIVYQGMRLIGSHIHSRVLTDHYPISADFEI